MTRSLLSRPSDMLRDSIRDVFPGWVRVLFWATPNARLLRIDGDGKDAINMPASALLSTEISKTHNKTVDAVIPNEQILLRRIHIPPSAVSGHASIAELDLLRRTPFAATDVYWALNPDRDSKSAELIQWVAKRTEVERFRKALQLHGYRVRKILTEQDGVQAVLSDFTNEIAPRAKLWRRLNTVIGLGIIACAFAIWLRPAWDAREAILRDTIIVNRLQTEALRLRSEIQELNQIDSERTAFVDTVMRRPRMVDALRNLTVALPDEVWLSDMLLSDDRITINGETSASAANLVLTLTQGDLAYIPALAGPVSRTSGGSERFSLVFEPKRRAP